MREPTPFNMVVFALAFVLLNVGVIAIVNALIK